MKITQYLMGTVVQVEVRREREAPAAEVALAKMRRIEQRMSRFLPESDVALLNAANSRPVRVCPETFAVLEEALRIAHLSDGAFDITVASEGEADFTDVLLDRSRHQVVFHKPGVAIDLGGVAKGYAVDRAIEVLHALGVRQALVNAGGDIRAMNGWAPWGMCSIGVQHPRNQRALLYKIPVRNKAIATSGDYYRFDSRGKQRGHHITDPQNGGVASRSMSATVVADRAMTADALATALFVLGPDRGLHLIESLPRVEGLVVSVDGRIHTSSGLWVKLGPDVLPEITSGPRSPWQLAQLRILLGTVALIGALLSGCQINGLFMPHPTQTQPVPTMTAESRELKDGTYSGESVSGVLVRVEVTVKKGRISGLEILEYREISWIQAGKPTEGEGIPWSTKRDEVLSTIPERILEKQSANVDAVTGATLSSNTIMDAVEDALSKATSKP